MSRGRILVIRGGAIGDFVLTLPALAALRQQFPQTHIAVLGYPHIASLAELAGTVNEVRSIEARALAGFFARRGELDKALSEWLGGFNMIVSYLYDPDEIFRENVARVSKAQFIAGPHRPDETANVHATEVFLKPLERLAIFGADNMPRLNIVSKRPREPGGMLAIHPGSGSEKKNWPEARWQKLFKLVATEREWRVLLVGGEAEGERLQRLASLMPIDRLTVAMNKPLPELATTLARCDAFLGHDSGITHLAAAVELRGVVLWRETNQHVWRPLNPRFTILHDDAAGTHLEAGPVLEAVTEIMK